MGSVILEKFVSGFNVLDCVKSDVDVLYVLAVCLLYAQSLKGRGQSPKT